MEQDKLIGIFPYAIDDELDFVVLFRRTTEPVYQQFGGTMDENVDPSPIFAAAKLLIKNSHGLLAPVNQQRISNQQTVERVTYDDWFDEQFRILLWKFLTLECDNLIQNIDNYFCYIFPMPYIDPEKLNACLEEQVQVDESFHWIKIENLLGSKPHHQFFSAADLSILQSINRKALKESILNPEVSQLFQKHYAIFHCESTENLQFHQPSFIKCPMLERSYLSDEIHWTIFDLPVDQFPSQQELETFDVVIISSCDLSFQEQNDLWVQKALETISQLAQSQTKILGINFGALLVTQALGGKVQQIPEITTIAIQQVCQLKAEFYEIPYIKHNLSKVEEPPKTFEVIKIHKEYISELPKGAQLQAYSMLQDLLIPEMFTIKEQILCIQGDPEFATSYLTRVILPGLQQAEQITAEDLEKCKASLNPAKLDFVRQIIYFFLCHQSDQ